MAPRFATTEWSQVLAVRGSGTQAREALEVLCATYWYPLYGYVRRSHDAEEARDLTQGFFTHLLEKDAFEAIDRSKGRFRSFLLASLENFLSHERDRAQALKRGGAAVTFSLDADQAETRYRREPADTLTPEHIYERRWALTVMECAMDRLEAEAAESESPELFGRLKSYLTGQEPHTPYRELGLEIGKSENAIKNRVHRLRRRWGQLLREEVARTVAEETEVDAELRHLLTSVSL